MLQMLKLSVSQVKRSGTDTSARRKSAIFDGFCEPRNGHGLTTGISTSLLTSKPGVTYAIAANMQITTRQSQIANFAPPLMHSPPHDELYLAVFTERNLVGFNAAASVVVLTAQEDTTTRHGVHYVKTRRHSQNGKYVTYRNESRPQSTCTENSVKFDYVVFEICQHTDRHVIGPLLNVVEHRANVVDICTLSKNIFLTRECQ